MLLSYDLRLIRQISRRFENEAIGDFTIDHKREIIYCLEYFNSSKMHIYYILNDYAREEYDVKEVHQKILLKPQDTP